MENKKKAILLLTKILLVIMIVIITFTFIFGIHITREDTMDPALKSGDMVLFTRLDTSYAQNDVVIFNIDGQSCARRVVAVPGDTVDIGEEGGLIINGSLIQERGIYEDTFRYEEGIEFPIILKDNEYFVLGDSRENALDSRIFGAVSGKDINGKVFLVIRRNNI